MLPSRLGFWDTQEKQELPQDSHMSVSQMTDLGMEIRPPKVSGRECSEHSTKHRAGVETNWGLPSKTRGGFHHISCFHVLLPIQMDALNTRAAFRGCFVLEKEAAKLPAQSGSSEGWFN